MFFLSKIAFRNIFRNRTRSLATAIAMTSGYIGIVLLGSFLIRVHNGLKAVSIYAHMTGHVLVQLEGSKDFFAANPETYQLTGEHLSQIEEVLKTESDQIEFSGKVLTGSGMVSNGSRLVPFLATGYEPDVYRRAYAHPYLVKWAGDWLSSSNTSNGDLSITKGMAELLGVDDQLKNNELQLVAKNFFGDLNAVDATVLAFHSTGLSLAEDTSLMAPLKTLQDLYSTDGVQYVALFLKEGVSSGAFISRLQKKLNEQKSRFEVLSFDHEKVNPFYVGMTGFLRSLGGFFVFLICGTVVISVTNSITISLVERTREIGVFRSLGYGRIFIQRLIAQEILFLSLLSSVFGFFLSLMVAKGINAINIRFSPPGLAGDVQFLLAPENWLFITTAVVLAVMSVLTSISVVFSKNKLKIVELLSDSGA